MSITRSNDAAQGRALIASAQAALTKPNPLAEAALVNSAKANIPPIAISPSQGQFLSILCQISHATRILEIGTLGAYSTIFFAKSSPDAHVTSLEFNARHRDVALQNLQGMKNVKIILGDAMETLPKLVAEDKVYDFVFVDADWDHQKEYFDAGVKLVRSGGVVYVDNAVRAITDAEDGVEPMSLVNAVRGDDRVNVALIPTLNSFHQSAETVVDGFLIAIKK